MDILKLNCWIRSQDAGRGFPVEISRSKTVTALKKAIKNEMSEVFRDIDADEVPLYKPKVPVSSPFKEDLRKFILSEHGEPLVDALDELWEVFPEPLSELDYHVIVDAPSITCWLRGVSLKDRFSTRPCTTVSRFRRAIKEAQPNLRDVADYHIRLFRISGDDNELRESLTKTGDGQLLQGDTLAPNFLGVPVLDPLFVVIEVPASTVAEARKVFIGDHPPKQLPSDSSKPSVFREAQRRTKELIPCGRPRDPEEVIPVTLLHPVFGQFLDDCQNTTISMKEVDNQLAGKLANTMSYLHVDKKQRVNAVAAVFKDVRLKFNLHQKVPGTSYEMDASLSVDRSDLPPYFIGEFNNEVTGTSGLYMQAIAHHLEATQGSAVKWSESALPCFLMIAFGPYMVFAGAVWNLRPVIQILSTPLSFHYHSTDTQHQLTVARHMAAFRNALRTLEAYYKDFVNGHQCNGMLFPYPANFTCLADNIPQTICYTNQFMERCKKELLVFLGTLKENAAVKLCIKFTQRYSKEVHQRCVNLGFAPKLRGFEELPGGWYMVVMDDVVGYQLLSELPPGERLPKSVFDDFKNKLEQLHASGLVHGDIRDANIFIKKDNDRTEFMVFDFDWAGKIGDVRYPPYVNHTNIKRPTGVRDSLLIEPAHDLEMLGIITDTWAAKNS